jgi:hypothetical protein
VKGVGTSRKSRKPRRLTASPRPETGDKLLRYLSGTPHHPEAFHSDGSLGPPAAGRSPEKNPPQFRGHPTHHCHIQTYAGIGNFTPNTPLKKVCPSHLGGNNYWPSSYSPRTKLLYIPALTGCDRVEVQRNRSYPLNGFGNVWAGGNASTDELVESNLTAVDPLSQEIRRNVQTPSSAGGY